MLRAMLVLSVLWAGAVAWRALITWPTVPLDMSRNDPATEAAFKAAQWVHAGGHALIGLAPLLIVLLITVIMDRRNPRG